MARTAPSGDMATSAACSTSAFSPARSVVAIAVARRAEPRRRLEQTGDHRRLVKRHLARRLVEIAVRGGVDAVGAGAEIDAVEVDLEQLVLGEFVLEPERQQRLLHLARQSSAR